MSSITPPPSPPLDEDIKFMKFMLKKSKTEEFDLWRTFGEILADLMDKRRNLLHSDSPSLKQKIFLEVSSRILINKEEVEVEVDVDGRPSSKKIKLELPVVGSSGLKKKDLEEDGSETRLSDIEFTFEGPILQSNEEIWGLGASENHNRKE